MKLLSPGPVTLAADVRAALARADIGHREPECAALTRAIVTRLEAVYAEAARHRAVLLTGSGTAAVEAMLGTLVPRDGHALVAANGVYGERAATILAAHGTPFTLLRGAWTAPLDVAAVESRLAAGGVSHVVAVHHETTTGRLNDIAALGALCRRHDVPLLLDAVSSFGSEPIRFEAWNVAGCASTAAKCLHGAPGIAFVLARRDALTPAAGRARSVYLDLALHAEAQASGTWPFTPAVHVLAAFDAALTALVADGGWVGRRVRYAALADRVIDGLAALGLPLLLESRAAYAACLTSFRLPAGVTYERLHDALKRDGFVVYAGQGPLAGTIVRIGVMGEIDRGDVDRLLVSVRAALR
jgi:2-aminoethylphosphonate-pyruvate transaminase